MKIMDGFKTIKQIYHNVEKYLHVLFLKLPCYSAFNNWLNKLAHVFILLIKLYQSNLLADSYALHYYLTILGQLQWYKKAKDFKLN